MFSINKIVINLTSNLYIYVHTHICIYIFNLNAENYE
jgi:hypothetical protein